MDRRLIFPSSDAIFLFVCLFVLFFFQRAMPFRNFDYQLYVLFSVLYMRKTSIKQDK